MMLTAYHVARKPHGIGESLLYSINLAPRIYQRRDSLELLWSSHVHLLPIKFLLPMSHVYCKADETHIVAGCDVCESGGGVCSHTGTRDRRLQSSAELKGSKY